jgi:hypothetical protein
MSNMYIDPGPSEEIKSTSCAKTSPYWNNNNLYLPQTNFENLKIRINLIFLHRNDGTGMFSQSNPEHVELINEIIVNTNLRYNELINSSDLNCHIPYGFLPSSKIEFVPNIIHINDEFGWNNENDSEYYNCPGSPNWYLNYINDLIHNTYPKGINVFFTETASYYQALIIDQSTQAGGPINWACSQFPSRNDLARSSKIHMPNLFTKYWRMKNISTIQYGQPWDPIVREWFVSGASATLAHELGHSFDLTHINNCLWSIMNPSGSAYHRTFNPTEIGTMHRFLSISNIRQFVTDNSFITIPLNINSNTVFDLNIKLYRDIILNQGKNLSITCEFHLTPQATVTIKNGGLLSIDGKVYLKSDNNIILEPGGELIVTGTLDMGNNGRIIVKPGAKLTIDGGTITSSSTNMWAGIYVEGNPNLSQTFANQGALILQNGAIIENAWDAVKLRSVGSNWRQNGGIIQATDAIFRNNWRNVEFMSYDYPSVSFFTNCIFETNSQTLHTQHTSNVTMWNVQAVKFTNCTFQDTRPNIDYYTYRKSRDGIYTIDASFDVSNNCQFLGMKYGIYATSSFDNRPVKVYQSNFSSFRGIYLNNMNNSNVANNTFYVKPGYMYSGENPIETYGIYLENSRNYQITGNILTSTGIGAPCNCNSYGVIVRNTGPMPQEIYRNDFTGFNIGIQAIGQNRDYHEFSGLQIRCNRFYNTQNTDIFVVKDPLLSPTIKQGIKQQQGGIHTSFSNTRLSGNIFTPNKWYYNNAEPFGYYHHNTSSHPNLIPSHYSTSRITLYQKNFNYNYATSCPARLLSPPRQMMLAEMENGLAGQGATEIKLLEMTDAGSTQLMLQQVEMANVGDAYHTYRHLMKTSPWLSEEVLVAVASREEGFTHAMIRDILVANPQAAKSEKVMQALKNRRNVLPKFMMAQVENKANQLSEKELLEFQIMSYKDMHDMALNNIIRNTMQNPENKSEYASLKELLTKVDDRSYQYLLSEILFSEKDYAAGKRVIKSIEPRFPFKDKNEWNHHEKFISFYNLLEKWDNEEHPGFSNLPEEVLTELKSYVNTGHRTSGAALAILMLNNAIEYKEPIYYPEEEMVAKTAATAAPLEILAAQPQEGFDFRVFPNPGRDYITFEWCTEAETTNNSRIEICNAAGVLSRSLEVSEPCNQALFSLENLQSGNYIAKFISGTTAKNISFVVTR